MAAAALAAAALAAASLCFGGCSHAAPPAAHATAPPATAPPPPPPTTTTAPVPPPPYPVSSSTTTFVDSSRPTVSRGVRISAVRTLTTVLWYPDLAGRWPLVLFAAGYKVGPSTYRALLQTWAAAGYVVAAPEFPLEDQAVAGASLDESDLSNEPADVSFVMASLLAPSDPLATRIAAGRVAVAGHSDGAEVALALAQDGNPAVVAAIVMSGQPVTPRQAPNPPLLVIQGDHDTTNPPSDGQAVFAQANSPKFFLDLLGGGHLPPYQPGTVWEPVVATTTVDFLDHYLSGRPGGDAPMMAAGNRAGVATLR